MRALSDIPTESFTAGSIMLPILQHRHARLDHIDCPHHHPQCGDDSNEGEGPVNSAWQAARSDLPKR